MKRIAIIGCAGSGKTTLALELQEIYKLPVYHLDCYYWKPNWQLPDFNDFLEIHDKLCDEPRWIIEGMYYRAMNHRLDRADTIIFLDMPRYLCIWRVLTRLSKNYGVVSKSSADQCPERFDLEFLTWIWHFNKRFRSAILILLKHVYADKQVHVISSSTELKRFIESTKKIT